VQRQDVRKLGEDELLMVERLSYRLWSSAGTPVGSNWTYLETDYKVQHQVSAFALRAKLPLPLSTVINRFSACEGRGDCSLCPSG